MKKYLNKEGHSGVTGYEVGTAGISVEFNHDAVYLYTYKSAGKKVVERMKELAEAGRGLSTYISQTVRENFEKKVR
ncbi:hypothetical protein Q765_06995 [Flavobacterium rivuli WB 3.3-2 = DSM 21788]|uniref:KTSC domain-containing protein n=1 Tax=Flavobacterium rivuli WB 3.3-2 = DSM 21788 TaxID=1121895 RepID=A0A0A2MGG2_9FLAO|nr:hypothetical protein [Flavobacterium rivuli]KGO87405.1 hypothetical protein Q765_06995 [Flavobacterium rivuli WB 3.3-2 = DSM 21788]